MSSVITLLRVLPEFYEYGTGTFIWRLLYVVLTGARRKSKDFAVRRLSLLCLLAINIILADTCGKSTVYYPVPRMRKQGVM